MLTCTDESKILAGGQSLLTLMKLRLAAPKTIIDINNITELSQIREENGEIVIGALTRHDQLARNGMIGEKFILLAEAASAIADQQVRNRGTIGGSLAHADPTADLPTACTALHASIVTASAKGSRSIESNDFFEDYFSTSLDQSEIIKEVRLPIPSPGSSGAYLKLTKGHNDFAVVAVAAQLSLGGDGICRGADVVLGGVASTPCHAKQTENFLIGRRLDEDVIQEGARMASEGLKPPSDLRASAEYRTDMAKDLTKRAIEKAVSRIHGSA